MTDEMSSEPDISHLDRVFYLFGHPIRHSLSHLVHNTVYEGLGFRWQQVQFESKDIDHFKRLLQNPICGGSAVTMPHKVAIIPHLNHLTPEGAAIGAINTIFFEEHQGRRILIGTNTDCIGIREAIIQNVSREAAARMRDRPAMIMGGGGTSRAAVFALQKWIGCSQIYMVNRDKSEVDAVIAECKARGFGDDIVYVRDQEHALSLQAPEVIVSAIPDFPPSSPNELRARAILQIMLSKQKGAILEMCYHPSPNTLIANLAKEAGWQVILGTEAMIWQGLEQAKYWSGRPISEMPLVKVKEVVSSALWRPSL
jgi:quinate dehydrogenase